MAITTYRLAQARSTRHWTLANEVLYELCDRHPLHTDVGTVVSKVWLIGRAYAAAIERRRKNLEPNDQFYVSTVAPQIVRSDIDKWIATARSVEPSSPEALPTLLMVHHRLTALFTRISGLEKRSLASKYLHFHVPSLFYIYDTRAEKALRAFTPVVGRASPSMDGVDLKYQSFARRCSRLQSHIEGRFGYRPIPREIDNLLLDAYAREQ